MQVSVIKTDLVGNVSQAPVLVHEILDMFVHGYPGDYGHG
jgi:hypothetical protein